MADPTRDEVLAAIAIIQAAEAAALAATVAPAVVADAAVAPVADVAPVAAVVEVPAVEGPAPVDSPLVLKRVRVLNDLVSEYLALVGKLPATASQYETDAMIRAADELLLNKLRITLAI